PALTLLAWSDYPPPHQASALSLHAALPIYRCRAASRAWERWATPWAAGWGCWRGATGSPPTTCAASNWPPWTARCARSPRTASPSCSGACAAGRQLRRGHRNGDRAGAGHRPLRRLVVLRRRRGAPRAGSLAGVDEHRAGGDDLGGGRAAVPGRGGGSGAAARPVRRPDPTRPPRQRRGRRAGAAAAARTRPPPAGHPARAPVRRIGLGVRRTRPTARLPQRPLAARRPRPARTGHP